MTKNKVLFGEEMIKVLKAGMDTVHRAVASTMGAAGRNTIYRSDYSGRPIATNDGISIARRIALEDEGEAMGAELITQAAERTNDEARDGTTTAIVLTHAMIEKGLEKVKQGKNSMVLRKEMQASVVSMVVALKALAAPIKTDKDIFNIANLSMENPVIAKIIADSVKKVGEDGIVIVEESSGLGIERIDVDGLKFDKGYLSPYMVTNPQTMDAVIDKVHILVTDKVLSMNTDFFQILEALNAKGIKKLLVICGGMNGEMLSTVIANRMQNKFHCVVVEKPYDENVLEDIAVVTGARNITAMNHPGDMVQDDVQYLGYAEKIIVTKDSTLVVGGGGKKKDVEDRVTLLKKEIKDTEHEHLKERMKERMAKIVGGVVILRVGAPTEAEMKYLKLKVDDAVGSTRAALQEGIVVGGGKTLFDLSLGKPRNDGDEVVKYACSIPLKQIMENAGYKYVEGQKGVFNALTGQFTSDPVKDGIVDPVKVERCALQNAVSLAGIFLTTESVVIDIPDKKD